MTPRRKVQSVVQGVRRTECGQAMLGIFVSRGAECTCDAIGNW